MSLTVKTLVGPGPAVLVIVPVLGRPHRAEPLAESLAASAADVPLGVRFICSPNDDAQIDAVRQVCSVEAAPVAPGELEMVGFYLVDWQPGPGDWARKINYAYRDSPEKAPWLFTGADDLRFHHGWADRALEAAERTGALVVGTNDLGNPRVKAGRHATHSLVARAYADEHGTAEGPGAVVSEAYCHNFVDDELVATAKARNVYTFAADSHVEHLHPNWGKGARDEVYDMGEKDFMRDRILFNRRRRLWAHGRR